MIEKSSDSKSMHKARSLLSSMIGASLTIEEREKKAIELASCLVTESNERLTKKEKKRCKELSRMMRDPVGKAFVMVMTDQCFRSKNFKRIADQMIYLINLYGIPKFFSLMKRLMLYLFKLLGETFPNFLVFLVIHHLRTKTSNIILPGEKKMLLRHIKKRKAQNVQLNLHRLGEGSFGEEETLKRLNLYLNDLKQPLIDAISVKISTLYSQINLLAWDHTLSILSERLRKIYLAAMKYPTTLKDGRKTSKFINLDIEEYHALHLTKELFMKVLSEPEFLSLSAGITLQAYLPDSFDILQEITTWAMERVKKGGAHIKLRLVKGGNLAMEQHKASLKGWPQAPYTNKLYTDANFKRMLIFACQSQHARAVYIGVASHNVFDIAFALLLRLENRVEHEVSFEMLAGISDPLSRVVQALSGEMLLYYAVALRENFLMSIAYLIRRFNENTNAESFLAHSFYLKANTKEWDVQAALFSESCKGIEKVEKKARHRQNRFDAPHHLDINAPFENEVDTDFSLMQNRQWGNALIAKWKEKKIDPIPLVIDGKEIHSVNEGKGYDPSYPSRPLYTYSLANWEEIDQALRCAKKEELSWSKTSSEERCLLLSEVAKTLRENRANQLGSLVADGGKLLTEADSEYSKTIDFAEYYLRCMRQLNRYQDIKWTPKGTILVASSWNFPNAIPAGGIFSALVTGNCVLFKPAPETVLAGYELTKILWEAGVPKTILQFIPCEDDPTGSQLIKDERVNSIILTGATSTAHLFAKMRPGIDLSAETGGKNALIITAMADRELAIKDLVQSAFGHSGQKCSAASIAILEEEVYDDPHFMEQLKDAANSLKVESSWDLSSKMPPLIKKPIDPLLQGLTTLEQGESWLLTPKQAPHNPNLWSVGIKLGVRQGSFSQRTELFGPVLSIIRAKNLDHAIHIANATAYGLTSGIHTLDTREQKKWQRLIITGNGYINRPITGAIVHRQPFGGCKNSSYGQGFKVGGPNYLSQFMHAKQIGIPKEKFPVGDWVNNLTRFLEKFDLDAEALGIWYASISSYAFFWHQFKRDKDRSKIVGEDNFIRYLPYKKLVLRLSPKDSPLDYLRAFAAALTTETRLDISWEKGKDEKVRQANWEAMLPIFNILEEDEDSFAQRVKSGKIKRIRMLHEPSLKLKNAAAEGNAYIDHAPVLANGRIELLHTLREMSLTISYHRYGNLGLREGELRKAIL